VPSDAGHRHDAVLERLPEGLQHGAGKLGELGEKKDATVCERPLA
jgi:hypothetical protein